MGQNELILKHLQAGKTITPLEALKAYGCFRLGARIYDLKQKGYKIATDKVHTQDKTFARYRLILGQE